MDTDEALTSKLEEYLALLLRWNERINLIGSTTTENAWQRHIEDCLQVAHLTPPGNDPVADLGSGAGLPGIVIALTMPSRPLYLVESDRRKAAFLNEAAARLQLDHVAVHALRIEDAVLPPVAVVTARALAPLSTLLVYAHRFLAPGGVAIFPKGRRLDTELAAVDVRWHFRSERIPSNTDPDATILRVTELHHG